jgi:hypothetical protein
MKPIYRSTSITMVDPCSDGMRWEAEFCVSKGKKCFAEIKRFKTPEQASEWLNSMHILIRFAQFLF